MVHKKNVLKDQVIYNEGDPPVLFYILGSGHVNVMMKSIDSVPIVKIKTGFFGEYELIKNINRRYTVIA